MKRRYPVTFIISAIMLVASCIISAMMLYNYDRAKFAVAIIPTAVFAVIFFIDLALAEKFTQIYRQAQRGGRYR